MTGIQGLDRDPTLSELVIQRAALLEEFPVGSVWAHQRLWRYKVVGLAWSVRRPKSWDVLYCEDGWSDVVFSRPVESFREKFARWATPDGEHG